MVASFQSFLSFCKNNSIFQSHLGRLPSQHDRLVLYRAVVYVKACGWRKGDCVRDPVRQASTMM